MTETRPAPYHTTEIYPRMDWIEDLTMRYLWLYDDPAKRWVDNLPDIEAWNRLGDPK